MYVATLLVNPANPSLEPSLVESLRNAWGGGEAHWLNPGIAAEFTLEALRKFVLVGCVSKIAWPVVKIVDVAINHEAVSLAAPLRIELTVARHDPVEIFLGSAEVIEILIKWFQQPNFGE